MQLINNQYYVADLIREEKNYTLYKVQDIMKANQSKHLIMIESQKDNQEFIRFMKDNIYDYSNFYHPNLAEFFFFNRANIIDNKNVITNKYYLTMENLEGRNLFDMSASLSFKEKLDLIMQLCSAAKYLHLRGFLLCNINKQEIYVTEENQEYLLKLGTIPYPKNTEIKRIIDKENKIFKAPEVYKNGCYTISSDIYLLGMIIFYFISGINISKTSFTENMKSFNFEQDENLLKIKDIILKCTNINPNKRYEDLLQLADDINNKFGTEYKIIVKSSIERMPIFRAKLVAEKKYINKIISYARKFFYEDSYIRGAFVKFTEGLRKDDFIKNLYDRSNQEGYTVNVLSINREAVIPFEYITPFIKELLAVCDKDISSKYSEILSIVSDEMVKEISEPLTEESRMKLRFRYANFISEAIAKTTRILIAENLFLADEESLQVLKLLYESNKNNNCNDLFIVASEDESITNYNDKIDEFEKILHQDDIYRIKLTNYSINETAEYIKNILGTSKVSLEFVTGVFKQTEGAPEYIYVLLQGLLNNKSIYVDDKGEWVFNKVKFNKINIVFNLDEITINKINSLEPIYNNALKIASVYESVVTPQLLASQMGIDQNSALDILNYLSYINIMIRKVDDWGISYDFKSFNLKKIIYDKITPAEKTRYHLSAALELEEVIEGAGYNNNELIYHLINSNRTNKAIELLMKSAMEFSENNLTNQAIQQLNQAYELFRAEDNSHKKLSICVELGRLYLQSNNFMKSLEFLDEAEKLSNIHEDYKNLIDICINKIYIFNNLKDNKSSLNYIKRVKGLLRGTDYYEGLYEYILCLNDVMTDKRKYNSYVKILHNTLTNIEKDKYPKYYARLLTQYGISILGTKKLGGSIDILQEAAVIFEDLGEYKYLPQVYNAMGNCCMDIFNDYNKAKDYYEKALGISIKTNNQKYTQKIYNNIAEIYREKDKYSKALEYYKQSIEAAKAIQRKYNEVLVEINIVMLNTAMEDYNSALKLLENIQATLNENKDLGDLTRYFYDIKSQYCYKLGYYELAKGYAQKSVDMCTSWGLPYNMESLFLKRLAEIQLTESLSFQQDMNLCRSIFQDNLFKMGREACCQLSEIYAYKELQDEAREFMRLGLSYVDKIDTDILKTQYQYIDAITSNEEDRQLKLIQAAASMENIENLEIKWKIYKAIAETSFVREEYQDALKHYISALNVLRKLVHNVPDEYKTSFVLSHGRNTVKEGLKRISEIIMRSKGIEENVQRDINKITLQNLDKYFDYTSYIDIYREGEEEESQEAKVDEGTYNKLLYKIRDLVSQFGDNNIENIRNIVNLCTETTQAKNAFIATLDEEDDLNILASYNRYSENSFYKYVIEQARQKKDGIIVTDVFDYNKNKGDLLIPKEITAVFCIPIMGSKDDDELGLLKERRKQKQQNESNIIGYLYLDTDSIINNFTQESVYFCKILSKVAYILVDNYNLKIVSTVDKLTKLYTRKYFETALQNEIDYSEKEGLEFSVIMIDIDKFKAVNDRFGHQRGDEILQGVAGTILNSIRKDDIAARYGGEEIIILLPNTGEEEGFNVAEKLRKKVENARLLGLHNPLTISLGVSTYPHHSTWAKDLIEKADQALYFAKENGRNSGCLYRDDMSKTAKRIDKLAGIISGNLVEDQRRVETMLEVLELQRSTELGIREKLFNFLGRIIEVSEAQTGILFNIGEDGEIKNKLARKKFISTEVEEEHYNNEIVDKCIKSGTGEYRVDWNSYQGLDSVTGMPDWQSVMAVPIIKQGELKGVLYLSASIKTREFDAGQYNFVKTLSDIISSIYA